MFNKLTMPVTLMKSARPFASVKELLTCLLIGFSFVRVSGWEREKMMIAFNFVYLCWKLRFSLNGL